MKQCIPPLMLATLMTAGLVACGGGDDGGATSAPAPAPTPAPTPVPSPGAKTGQFYDAAVAGLEYTTSSGGNAIGMTDASGVFSYRDGDAVTFRIGDLVLGQTKGKDKVTLADFDPANPLSDKVIARARLLQTLDADHDPDNGIAIEAAARNALKGKTLPLDDMQAFDAAASGVLGRAPVSAASAREHFESTLAMLGGTATTKVNASGVTLEISKYRVQVPTGFHVAYPGSDAGIKAAFPQGFPLSIGSSIAYKGKEADGSQLFYILTDRGPNGDSPDQVDGKKSKVFPVPGFNPKIGLMRLKNGVARVESTTDLKDVDGSAMSGLPIPDGSVGASNEVALNEALGKLAPGYSPHGIDPEGLSIDKDGKLWLTDEYGPFLAQLDPATGKLLKKLAPGSGLPAIIAKRQANRGFEGVAVTPSGKIVAMVQSILAMDDAKDSNNKAQKTSKAPVIRLVEYDPANGATRMLAYPFDTALYGKAKDAKLGDLIALSDTRFLLIEQGEQKDGVVHNMLVLIDTSAATDLTGKTVNGLEVEYQSDLAVIKTAGITPVAKRVLADLRDAKFGWVAEKAEGLTLIDASTIALINDNDFGLSGKIIDDKGVSLKGDDCSQDANGTLTGSKCATLVNPKYRIGQGSDDERPSRLWIIRFGTPLKDIAL
ncbi:esterase-like activity of phytase family protein [Jeongeupia naejangsanensis]|uniref:Esterase-like activity of phytase family protein n=1 Tax=Jeongeupia naejangsanensis TaxID=613195 RepID=A0ABS2BFH8_9NEIS|nr:esterase-like activity of phytase family protein [Jeongeupia naejangsanensis]MBM3114367.1 esterase-like activity of phytase family protein [Jeongeupia naejangsanensis]